MKIVIESMKRQKIVVIGGGFAGIQVVKSLKSLPVDITIIDKQNHHLFQPLLYQVATSSLSPGDIAYPIRAIFSEDQNVQVLMGQVDAIDRVQRQVMINESDLVLDYDYLIVAVGARHSYFGHPEWEVFAPGLKTLEDAVKIRERILVSFEKAERTTDLLKRQSYLTFVIIGAGPTGVEMAGAISEIARQTLIKDFRRFNPQDAKVILIEGANRVLGRYPERSSDTALKSLQELGVDVRLQSIITNVTSDGVSVGDHFIPAHTVIWAAGNMAAPLVNSVTDHRNKMGQALVKPDFSTPEDPRVFCIGDCAYLEDVTGNIVPGVAQGAIQAGTFVAKQIIRDREGKPRTAFRYSNRGKMATVGKARAVADVFGVSFSGFFAWFLWSFVHVLFLINFRKKIVVFLEWGWSYFFNTRDVRLIKRS